MGKHYKTLGSLLRYFEGMEIAVELKNGKIYQGTLESESADQNMSLTLTDARIVTTATLGKEPSLPAEAFDMFQILQVRGSQVRYIHFLDDNSDLERIVKNGMEREQRAAQKYKRGVRKEK